MNYYCLTFYLFCLLPATLWGQKPDFAADTLGIVSGKDYVQNKKDIRVSAKIYCDGEAITVVIDVKDDIIENKTDNFETDHVEIWLALPASAYPSNFEYNFHPKYIYGTTGPNQTPRFFSVYSEYANGIGLNSFTKNFDYPDSKKAATQNLNVPKPEYLRECRMDFGIVHYGFYPDQRKVVHYNKDNYRMLEQVLGVKMGNFAEGAHYVCDKTEQGYKITVEFTPQSLGFVQLPKLEELRFMIDVVDKDGQGKKATTVLSTSAEHQKASPAAFNTVRFKKPLKTNNTQIPDAVFNKLDFHPLYTLTDSAWVSTSIETDMAVFSKENLSKSITEIKFSVQPVKYTAYEDLSKNTVKRVIVEKTGVNSRPITTEYYIVNGQVFESELVKMGKSRKEALNNYTFSFPDGSAGLILKQRTALNPYGWGKCGNCYEEVISLMRIKGNEAKTLLAIYQGNSGEKYCQIGEQSFRGYYVASVEWVREGKTMLLRLSSWDNATRKRVRVSWNDDGSKIAMKELE